MHRQELETALEAIEKEEAEEEKKRYERELRKKNLLQQKMIMQQLAKPPSKPPIQKVAADSVEEESHWYKYMHPNKALWQASQEGDLDAINALIENRAKITSYDQERYEGPAP